MGYKLDGELHGRYDGRMVAWIVGWLAIAMTTYHVCAATKVQAHATTTSGTVYRRQPAY